MRISSDWDGTVVQLEQMAAPDGGWHNDRFSKGVDQAEGRDREQVGDEAIRGKQGS